MRISVVTVAYNSASTISDTLVSVAAQTHSAIEHIVIDGGSSDGTADLVRDHSTRVARFVSEPDHGIYDALNKGLRLATGDVVGFLHADDLFADHDVVADIAARFEDPQVDAVYGDLVYVDAIDVDKVIRFWRAGPFDTSLLRRGWMPPHPTLYVRRAVYERLGGFDTRYRIAADYDTIVRFFGAAGLKVAYVPRVLVRMRLGGISNRSIKTIWRKTLEDRDIIRRYGTGGIGTLLSKNFGKLSQFWRR